MRHEFLDRVTQHIFGLRCQSSRSAIIKHRRIGLVAAFAKHSSRCDVARHIIAVGVNPQPVAVEHVVHADRIIHHDFSAKKHHCKVITEAPCLHGIVRNGRWNLFAFVEHLQKVASPRTGDAGLSGLLFPVGSRRQRPQRQIDARHAAVNVWVDGMQYGFRRAVGRQPSECVFFTFAKRVVSEG